MHLGELQKINQKEVVNTGAGFVIFFYMYKQGSCVIRLKRNTISIEDNSTIAPHLSI